MHEGGCLCGSIRFRFGTTDITCAICYCRDCQYISGGEPAAVVRVRRNSLTIDGSPTEYLSIADSGTEVSRSFCPRCGTPLFASNPKDPEYIAVKAGALDDPSIFDAQLNVWPESAQSWHSVDDSLPKISRNQQT